MTDPNYNIKIEINKLQKQLNSMNGNEELFNSILIKLSNLKQQLEIKQTENDAASHLEYKAYASK